MKNAFVDAANPLAEEALNKTKTDNGAIAYRSTLNANLDFFAHSGNVKYPNLIDHFNRALAEDEDIALRNLLNMRDIRTGKGVRKNSRTLLEYLGINHPSLITKTNLVQKIVELGRWDDLFCLLKTSNHTIIGQVVKFIATEMKKDSPDGLLFKWLPINSKQPEEKLLTSKLRSYLKLSPKEFRKFVSSKRVQFIPEYKFCNKQWSLLDYSTVPSQCFRKNKNAFKRNDTERFTTFIERVIKGDDPKAVIKAGAIYPHEVIGPINLRWNSSQYSQLLVQYITPSVEAQWKSLPDFVPEDVKILPIIDTSSSMWSLAQGSFACMNISVALGIYFAERSKSAYKDLFLTFNSTPQFVSLSNQPNLLSKYAHTLSAPWSGSTNIQKTFELVLSHAIKNKVPQHDMPNYIVCVTDGQFNSMTSSSNSPVIKQVKDMFAKAGYEFPTLVFWNVSANSANVPATFNEDGVALLSGYSTALLKSLFNGELAKYTPLNVMLATLDDEKYKITYTE